MTRTPLKIAIGVALLGAAVPAFSQSDYDQGYHDDITVYAPERLPDDLQTLSQRVSYADLDLRDPAARAVLRDRVRDSAAEVCDRLDQNDFNRGVGSSCRDEAVSGAMRQVRYVEQQYMPEQREYASNGHAWLPRRDY